MKKNFPINTALSMLSRKAKTWSAPVGMLKAARGSKPFSILVSTVLSARTKDETTAAVTKKLFAKLKRPEAFLKLSVSEIEKRIYPVSFYKTKARNLQKLCRILAKKYHGKVPHTIDELLELPGVGRKTANLVVTEAFGAPGITVDTHVHRITNRWGYVRTKTPAETEVALRERLPKKWWITINPILVAFGQTICRPVSPHCSTCPVRKQCPRIGVKSSR